MFSHVGPFLIASPCDTVRITTVVLNRSTQHPPAGKPEFSGSSPSIDGGSTPSLVTTEATRLARPRSFICLPELLAPGFIAEVLGRSLETTTK